MKKKYFLVIDTETTGEIYTPLVYDVGAKVIDLQGRTYESMSSVIYEIYAKQREAMKSAYYVEKLPQYEEDLKSGKRKMHTFYTVRKTLFDWMEKYDIEAVCAYNMPFDKNALNNTYKFITEGKRKFFFPKETKYIDIWVMACSSIFQRKSYQQMAYENAWYSNKGNVLTNAEKAYCYLINRNDFEESHTALEDVEIESAIFTYCWRYTTEEERKVIYFPWRKPQKEWYYYEAHEDGII
jgi:hypothetical protein